ncbi:MAG: transglycosylase domain-containing protein [Actinomycetes bacterium]
MTKNQRQRRRNSERLNGEPSRRPITRRGLRTGVRVLLVVALGVPLMIGAAAASGFGSLLYGDLPGTVPEEHERVISRPSYVYDSTGAQIATFREFDLNLPMTKEDVPQVLKDAVIAAEDRKFWTHNGVDPEGLIRAAVTNYREGETVQGGSTITQQYVKNTYLSNERSVERKLNEAVLATRLERDLTQQLGSTRAAKEEILFRYLNTTYFGSGAYGAAAAAQSYFRTDVHDLSISQAAALVAIIPAPSKYGPRDDIGKAEQRRKEVLGEMRDQGSISDAQYEDAKAKVLWVDGFGTPSVPTTAVFGPPEKGAAQYPFFVDYVRRYLIDKYGEDAVYRGGLRVDTTIDPRLQGLAETAVTDVVNKARPDPAGHPLGMALVSVEPSTGYVKAMVGGQDFATSQVNLALGGSTGFQPGSSMKPYTMAAALELGVTPETVFPAVGAWPVPGCRKTPTNSCVINGEAASTMAPAIAESSNTYFAELAYDIGPNNIARMANRLGARATPGAPIGIDATRTNYAVGLTLGTSELSPLNQAVGFATFVNHGVRHDPTPVTRVTEPNGRVLENNANQPGTPVLNAAIADTVTDLLRGPVTFGTASRSLADFGRPAAGKTGTTQNNADAWFVGFTPQLSTAVWLGHTDGINTLVGFGSGPVFGGTVPAATWKAFMKPALEGVAPLDFVIPGALPAPGGGGLDQGAPLDSGARRANELNVPDLPRDCGGPCIAADAPALPKPVTPSPPSSAPATEATTTTTTKKKGP